MIRIEIILAGKYVMTRNLTAAGQAHSNGVFNGFAIKFRQRTRMPQRNDANICIWFGAKRIGIGRNQGLFRVRPLVESRAFPEIGFYRQEDELMDHSSNELLLRQIARSTGGRFDPPLKDIFNAGGRSIPSSMELWPGLLALAILLNLVELFMRKWRGLIESIRRPAESAA